MAKLSLGEIDAVLVAIHDQHKQKLQQGNLKRQGGAVKPATGYSGTDVRAIVSDVTKGRVKLALMKRAKITGARVLSSGVGVREEQVQGGAPAAAIKAGRPMTRVNQLSQFRHKR